MRKTNDVDLIIPHLWLGNYDTSQNEQFMRQNKINVVVNCTKNVPFIDLTSNSDIKNELCRYKYRVAVEDDLTTKEIKKMKEYLDTIIDYVRHHMLKERNVFIHCMAGMQRSAIICYCYLCKYEYPDNHRTAFNIMRRERPIVFTPGMNFENAYLEYFKDSLQPKPKQKRRQKQV